MLLLKGKNGINFVGLSNNKIRETIRSLADSRLMKRDKEFVANCFSIIALNAYKIGYFSRACNFEEDDFDENQFSLQNESLLKMLILEIFDLKESNVIRN